MCNNLDINQVEIDAQIWWNTYFGKRIRYSDYKPTPLATFRQEMMEPDFNRFLPWIIESCCGFSGVTIEDMFILDESAKKYLYENAPELLEQYGCNEIQTYLHERKNDVDTILPKEEKVSWWNRMKQMFEKLLNHFPKKE